MNTGIIVAAGKSKRAGTDVDKVFLSLGPRPVLVYSLLAFEKCPEIENVILVVQQSRIESARGAVRMFGATKVTKIISGGRQRQFSVAKGLAELSEDVNIVVIHDGARPCVTSQLISETIQSAKRYGSGIAAAKITDTVKEVKHGMYISKTIDRTKLWRVQTPQAFKLDLLLKGLKAVNRKKLTITDEASAVELISKKVRLVPSSLSNIKITTPNDLVLAASLMRL